jgi:hypothetical protein
VNLKFLLLDFKPQAAILALDESIRPQRDKHIMKERIIKLSAVAYKIILWGKTPGDIIAAL